MKVGKNLGEIIDYGVTKTKLGSAQVFIRIAFEDGSESTWYGVAVKKDGEANEIMLAQLAHCGFDFSKNDVMDLFEGPSSGLLIMNEKIDVYCRNEMTQTGELALKISSLGAIGPNRVDVDEARSLLTSEQADKIRAIGSKFKPRQRKAKQNPEEPTPF